MGARQKLLSFLIAEVEGREAEDYATLRHFTFCCHRRFAIVLVYQQDERNQNNLIFK